MRKTFPRLIFPTILVLMGFSRENALAQNFCRPQKRPVAIISSGGSSLGAYQAGAMFRILQSLQMESSRYELKLLAGASAGGVNSLLAFQDACAERSPNWLYQFWTQPIAKELFSPAPRPELQSSLLNSKAFDEIQGRFFADWKRSTHSCDIVLSIPLTLRDPLKLNYSGQQQSNAQFLNFSLRAQPGSPARLSNYANPFENTTHFLLNLNPQNPEDSLAGIARATTSIPYIFPSEPLSFCPLLSQDPRLKEMHPPYQCPPQDQRVGEFIDGALLDATPLAQAVRSLKRGLQTNCQTSQSQWLDVPTLKNSTSLDPNILLINLDVRNRIRVESPQKESFSSGVFSLLGDLLQSARDRELTQVIDSEVNIRSQILSLQSHFPRWSEEWNGFFGFFDQDFRAFDFWVGYVDMEESLRKDFPDLLGSAEIWAKTPTSPLAQCLRLAVRAPSHFELGRNCPHLSLPEQQLLGILQVENRSPPKTEDENLSLFYRRLEKLSEVQFEFNELELSPSQTAQAPTLVRGWLGKSTRHFSQKFPHDSGTTLDAISGYLFGLTDPIPENKFFYMVWGNTFEVGGSQLISVDYRANRFWRWPLAVEVYAPRALSTSVEKAASFSLLTGLELQKPWSSGVEYLFSLRGGYQWTSGSPNPTMCLAGNPEYCRGPTFSPMIAAVFFQTLRLQTGVKFTWDPANSGNADVVGLFSGGLQF